MKSGRQIGQSLPRADGVGKVTGRTRYVDDLRIDGLWHGATVRVAQASGRILGIDASAARAADPEVVVLTAADLPGPNVVKLIADDWPVLAAERVQHPFEAVALVAAPSRERARRAAKAVQVEVAPLPALTTLAEVLEAEAAGTPPRLLASCAIDRGDVEAGLAGANLVLEAVYETGHHEHAYIEPQGVIALPSPEGGLRILGSLQCPYYVHHALLHLFGGPEEGISVQQVATGGGFGGKEDFPDLLAAHAGLLAKKVGRPVKIVYDRQEDMAVTTKRHPSRVRVRAGVREDGTLTALDIDVLLDGGAYVTLSPVVLSRAVLHAGGAYRCPNVRIRGRALATHTAPNGAFRGFGAPQSIFAIERHMDRLGRALDLDPLTIRERNAYRVGDTTPTGQVLHESVSALECLRVASERSDFRRRWQQYEIEREGVAGGSGRPMGGVGLSLFWHGSGFTGNGERRMMARAALRLLPGGEVEVLAASTEIGQGTDTVFPQIVADAMGVAVARIRTAPHDTAEVPDSGPTVASRTVMIVGGILHRAGREMSRRLCAFAAERRGLEAGSLRISGDRLLGPEGRDLGGFPEVAEAYLEAHGPLGVEEVFEPSGDLPFDEEHYRGSAYPAYGWGCDVVEVEVDPDTLAVRPTQVVSVVDVGRVINPVLCRGQVEGGTLQSIAWGYLEEIKLDRGRYLNDRLQTYVIPTAEDAPEIDAVLLQNPTSASPTGAKGVGEIPMDGGAPALLAAIENATGLPLTRLPATPEHLLALHLAGRSVQEVRS